MNGYQCWFCGQGIGRADEGAVMMSIESLWHWDAGFQRNDSPQQSIYAHTTCAKERMKGATMDLEPHIFGEDD